MLKKTDLLSNWTFLVAQSLQTERYLKDKLQIYQIGKMYSAMTAEEQMCNMLVQMGCESVKIYNNQEIVFHPSDDPWR